LLDRARPSWAARCWSDSNFQRNVYGSAALGPAFHDRSNVPKAIARALDHFSTTSAARGECDRRWPTAASRARTVLVSPGIML
jgi:hypothetical protein